MGDVRTWRCANGEYNTFELSKSVGFFLSPRVCQRALLFNVP